MKSLRLTYAILLQVEYILSLVTGVLLGYGRWFLFGVFLALCLVLGFATTWLYWKLLEGVNK